jgi:uncharacterized protein
MLEEKLKSLKEMLKSLGSVVVAYSGGVDSTFLAKVAFDVLGDKALAVTAKSEVHPQWEFEEAIEFAKEIGFNHETITAEALSVPKFSDNPPDRCYYCKKEILISLKELARERGLKYVIEGTNFDDLDDHRPGVRALTETGVRSPLKEAKLTKAEIRELSRRLGLPTWDKPSYACLASRFPYGIKITEEKLSAVDEAETFLRDFGIRQLRVRHHDQIARIEVAENDMETLLRNREQIVEKFKELGYAYITMDLQGYRTGSMNEVLSYGNSDK